MTNTPTRRDLLKAAPALAFMGALPTAASADTPVMALFREWREYHGCLNSGAARGLPEEEFDILLGRQTDLEDRILDEPAQSPHDFVAKVAAYTSFGEGALPGVDDAPTFWAEARALIGGAA